MSRSSLSSLLYLCGENTCMNIWINTPPHTLTHPAWPPLIIMTFLYHNNAIRSVFCNSSHLCYHCQQSKRCYYLHDRDRAFCNYWACLCSNYFSLLKYKSWKEGERGATALSWNRNILPEGEELRDFPWQQYYHIHSSARDCWQKICPISRNNHSFSLFLPIPPPFVTTVCPDRLTKDKAPQWVISINQTNQQELRPPISPPTSASHETPSQALLHVFVFLWLLLATYSGAGDNNYPVGNPSLTVPPLFLKWANQGWIMPANMLINLGFIQW